MAIALVGGDSTTTMIETVTATTLLAVTKFLPLALSLRLNASNYRGGRKCLPGIFYEGVSNV